MKVIAIQHEIQTIWSLLYCRWIGKRSHHLLCLSKRFKIHRIPQGFLLTIMDQSLLPLLNLELSLMTLVTLKSTLGLLKLNDVVLGFNRVDEWNLSVFQVSKYDLAFSTPGNLSLHSISELNHFLTIFFLLIQLPFEIDAWLTIVRTWYRWVHLLLTIIPYRGERIPEGERVNRLKNNNVLARQILPWD